MRNTLVALILLVFVVAPWPLAAQTNTDEVAQLKQRVARLEQQVQDISRFLEPLKGQQAIIFNRRRALQEKVEKRFAQDRDKYTPEQVLEAEKLYQVVSQKPGSPEEKDSLQNLIKNYSDMNRTGCAVLYVAQRSQGEARAKYLQECVEKYDDCLYGDGVQVGAYARFLMARDYSRKGETKKAEALRLEIKSQYAGAIDHGGNLLLDNLNTDPK